MPSRFNIQLDGLSATHRLASALARLVLPGDVLLLSGDLGAGKTTLVRTVAEQLGIDPRTVSSPTFTVMNEYRGGLIDPVVHMDAYRMEGDDEAELLELGWDDDLRNSSVAFIEWGERIADLVEELNEAAPARLHMQHAGETSRLAAVSIPDSWRDRTGFAQFADLVAALAAPIDQNDPARPSYPFATEREQMADLYHWFGESYRVSRPVEESDEQDV